MSNISTHIRRATAASAFAVAFLGASVAAATPESLPSRGASASGGGTLVVAQPGDAQPGTFLSSALGNLFTQYAVFDTLTRLDPDTSEPYGVLAESWDAPDDMTSMTIKMREDATFHSGRPVTSADVIYTLEQVMLPENAARTRSIAEHITDVEANGDFELTFTFDRPLPNIFDVFEIMPIIDRETFDDYGAGERVVGSGRFVWESWTPGGSVVLTKNADHWDADNVYYDSIEIHTISDPTALVAALRSGRVSYASGLPALDSRTIGSEPGYALVESGGSSLALGFDVQSEPFTDRSVRQAVHYAIDRERIVEQVLGGNGTPTALPWRASTLGYDVTQGDRYPYDPDLAAEMISDAGMEGVEFEIVVPDIPESLDVFEIVQNNLASIGLTATAQVISVTEYDERIGEGDFRAPAILMRNGNSFLPPTAVAIRAELRAEDNLFNADSEAFSVVADGVLNAVSEEEQTDALAAYNEYFLEEAFGLSIVIRPSLSVRSADIDGIEPTAQGFIDITGTHPAD